MEKNTLQDNFPLSKKRKIKGNRRLVREKVLQILFTLENSDTSLNDLFNHIFFRIFRFDENFEKTENRILKQEEIIEMEADLPIEWTDDEKEFGIRLMNHSINNKAKINELIEKFSQNWEISRIATIDKIIITIALTELMDFHEIPVKVSINEAIELSKQYSTEKSSYFINGLLDAAKNHLLDNNLIHKEGKGLLNQSVN